VGVGTKGEGSWGEKASNVNVIERERERARERERERVVELFLGE